MPELNVYNGTSRRCSPIKGQVSVPGDKSISHRALILGAVAAGETTIKGLLEGEDVLRCADALEIMGIDIKRPKSVHEGWKIYGRGIGGLFEPKSVLDMGNSGTAARLLIGLISGHPFTAFFTGDDSLKSRPMSRVMEPLEMMGADFQSAFEGKMPLSVTGTDQLVPIQFTLPIASAQIKSAILLAGLNTRGMTQVIEPKQTRDHLERMLQYFGADITCEKNTEGIQCINLIGQTELIGQDVVIPSDFSSAAFLIVAAIIVPGSQIKIIGVGINPLRTGLLKTLLEMGVKIEIENERLESGELIADISVESSAIKGVNVPLERVPSMIDEFPILSIAASCADGVTQMIGVGELRLKESDRLKAVAQGLTSCGVTVEEDHDSLVIHGCGSKKGYIPGGVTVSVNLDHRIAMSFLVLGMVSKYAITIDNVSVIDTSFPEFISIMNSIGANIFIE